jgi:hypothetical protein
MENSSGCWRRNHHDNFGYHIIVSDLHVFSMSTELNHKNNFVMRL